MSALGFVSRTLLIIWAVVLALMPFQRYLTDGGLSQAFNHFAADTYYYLRFADSFHELGITTFDGQTPTNGFNPLWQLLLILFRYFAPSANEDPMPLIEITLLGSLALLALGSLVLALFFAKRFGALQAAALLVLIIPGTYFFLFEPQFRVRPIPAFDMILSAGDGINYSYSSWSFANGMESSIGFFLFAVTVPLLFRIFEPQQTGTKLYFALGGMCFLIMMARLDDIFLGISVFLVMAPALLQQRRWGALCAFSAIPVLGSFLYIGFNLAAFGFPLPVSGLIKTRFFSFPNGLVDPGVPEVGYRIVPLMVFIIGGVCGTLVFWKRSAASVGFKVGLALAMYILLKGLFLFSSVPLSQQGYWYYSVGVTAFNIMVVILIEPQIAQPNWRTQLAAFGTALLIFSIHSTNVRERLRVSGPSDYVFAIRHICENHDRIRPALRKELEARGLPYRGIESGDGAMAYCLAMPSITFTGLANSVQVMDEIYEEGFLTTVFNRDFRVIMTSDAPWLSYFGQSYVEQKAFELETILSDGPVTFHILQKTEGQDYSSLHILE